MRMLKSKFFLLFIICLNLACTQSAVPEKPQPPPLVDGSSEEYLELGVEPISLSDEVDLYFYQDPFYVWICYTYPEESFGTMDLQIKTDQLSDTLNLHVSAQIGEWPLNQPDLAPQDPQSDKWWNAKGWIANPVWMNGLDRSTDNVRPRFKNDPARELQLSKSRFGTGNWSIKMEIRAIKGPDGELYSIQFPEGDSTYLFRVN